MELNRLILQARTSKNPVLAALLDKELADLIKTNTNARMED